MKNANALLRFVLELCTLGAFVYWGFATEDGLQAWLRAVGVPVLSVVVWGTFGAPGAPLRASVPVRLTLLAVVYGWAVIALWTSGQEALAAALGIAAAVNTALMFRLDQL